MTYTSIVDLIAAYTGVQGQAFVTAYSDVTDVFNRESKAFALETMCLYSDEITWTLTTSEPKYSLRSTSVFSKIVCYPVHVWVNDTLIPRVASVPDMAGIAPTYATDSDAMPGYWYTQPPHHIVLRPAPVSAYSNSRVEGWYLPDDVEFPDDGETDPTLEFSDEHLRPLAKHVAIALMEPRATGELRDRLRQLMEESLVEKRAIRAVADQMLQPAPVRRKGRRIYALS